MIVPAGSTSISASDVVLHYLYTADKRDGMACKFEASDGVTAEANLSYEQVIHSESFSIYLIHLPQVESNILD